MVWWIWLSDLDFKTETLKIIYNEIQSQIKYSDTKTGLLLASSGIMFVILFDIYKHLSGIGISSIQQTMVILSLFCNVASLVFYIISVFPRTGSDIDTVFYWGKIRQHTNDEYNQKISELTEEDLQKDLGNQICILSKICDTKMAYFKYGTAMLTASILIAGIQYFIIYA